MHFFPFIHYRLKEPTNCWKNSDLLCCSKIRIVFFCYCFLCVSLHHKGCFETSQKCKASTRKQLQENYVVVHHRQPNTRFKLLVPTLIIITFLLFTIDPNIIRIFAVRGDIYNIGYLIVYMFVPIGFVTDTFIYIFNLNVVGTKIITIIWRHIHIHSTNS